MVQTIVDPGQETGQIQWCQAMVLHVLHQCERTGECVGRTLKNDDATIVEAAKSVLADVDLDYIVATHDLLRVLRLLQRMAVHGIILLLNKRCLM